MKPAFTKWMAVLAVLALTLMTAWAQNGRGNQSNSNAVMNDPIEADVATPLSPASLALANAGNSASAAPFVHRPLATKANGGPFSGVNLNTVAGGTNNAGTLASLTTGLNMEGIGNSGSHNCPSVSGATVAPPDTNAAVGDTQVVQWVNLCYMVFNKTTGAVAAGPFKGNAFFVGMKSACATQNAGDPIIQFDKANHVWVASQNVFGPYLTCIAVSKTADITGAFNRYAFSQPGFPDYQKWGLTPNVYYQTQNDFGIGGNGYVGVNVCAYDGAGMRSGNKRAKQICILDNSGGTLFDDSLVPADNDYVDAGTQGAEVFLGSIDNGPANAQVYEVTMSNVNFKKGTATLNGTNGTMPLGGGPFTLGCGGFGACVPQPGLGSEVLDSLGDRLMYRVAHQSVGGTEHWVVTHSVSNADGTLSVRWYDFSALVGSTALTLNASGQTADDGEYRWMGSAAMDKTGNIAIGYSRSSANAGDFPSIYVSDTANNETLIHQGNGSQFNTANRWGDYSSMALDNDGCTLWYTTEFYPADGSFAWDTWLGSLKYSTCQ